MPKQPNHYEPRFTGDGSLVWWKPYGPGDEGYDLWPPYYLNTKAEVDQWHAAQASAAATQLRHKPKTGRLGINPKDAIGSRKVSFNNIPKRALGEVALAMMEGGLKYEPKNWRDAPVRLTVYTDAICRHAFALEEGQDHAQDGAKLHHLAYIAAGALIALDALLHGSLVDDRVALSTDPDFMTGLNARAAQVIAALGKPADA